MGYSNDLRVRVIQVVEGGAAARAAARQFVIGDSTAIRWTKRWRESGSFEAKSNKGQSRSPLKKHEEWLLGLVRQEPDLTLEEIQRRLLDERQQKAGIGSVWRFFDRHGISFKKKHSGGRAKSASPPPGPEGLGRQSTQARSRPTGLHRRNRHFNQNGAAAWPGTTRRTAGRQSPAWPLENHHLCCGPALHGTYGTMRHRRPDERQRFPRLCRTSPGADP